ncbi:hybrid sensor histidine kinase/response regulator, partial [Vibrio sp. V42_P2S4T144]|nr:hybrid sensor histidine kinase/response regulator [Vibrio sp. V42_P2S4T144]
MNILEFFIGVGLAITLIAFFSFKAQSNLLEAVESSHVAHSASLVHIRNYIHLLGSEDHAQISKILTQIEELTVALNDLSEASNDITVRFPRFFWLGDSLSHMVEDYTKTARGQLALLEKTIEAKQQTENKLSLQKLERIIFSDSMDEVAEQTHERLMSSIFLTSKAAVYSLILTTALTFSVIVLYLSHYITELKKTKLAL